jgi:hypothetical protein
MDEAIKRAAEAVKKMKADYRPHGPKGLPDMSQNANDRDQVYDREKLVEPVIKNMVTGSGNGPIICGRGGRAY